MRKSLIFAVLAMLVLPVVALFAADNEANADKGIKMRQLLVGQREAESWKGMVKYVPKQERGKGACFELFGKYPTPLTYAKYIPVSADRHYVIKASFRTVDEKLPASAYLGLELYDEQKRMIGHCHVLAYEGSETTVVSAKKGEKTMVIKKKDDKMLGYTPSAVVFNTKANYRDLPNFDVSPMVQKIEEDENGNLHLTLAAPLKNDYVADTPVRFQSPWSPSLYFLAQGWMPAGDGKDCEAKLFGIMDGPGTPANKFWMGTKYVRPFIWFGNWDRKPQEGAKIWVDGFSFEEEILDGDIENSEVVLTKDSEIVIPEKPNQVEKFAASELAYFLGTALGGKIQVKNGASDAKTVIMLGRAAFPEGGIRRDDIRFKFGNGKILIAGLDEDFSDKISYHRLLHLTRDKGTLEGVYTFLEDYAHVRWTEPGRDGEFVPKAAEIKVVGRDDTIRPAFSDRRPYNFDGLGNWNFPDEEYYGGWEGQFLWALRLRTGSWKTGVFGSHTPSHMRLKEQFFEEHPDWFALQEDGTRNPRWLCWTHPEVLDMWKRIADAWFRGDATPQAVIPCLNYWPEVFITRDQIMIEPYDTYGPHRCRCERCKAAGCETDKGLSDLLWKSIGELARYVEEKWPDKTFAILPYPPHQNIPDFKLPSNVRARICIPGPEQIAAGDIYKQQVDLINGWHDFLGSKIHFWTYMISSKLFGLYPLPLAASTLTQQYLREHRPVCEGIFCENGAPFKTVQLFEDYAQMHLMWDPELDLEALRDDYCQIQFGPAANAMKEFLLRLERDWTEVIRTEWPEDRPAHPWSRSNNEQKTKEAFQNIYTAEEMAVIDGLLKKAEGLVKDSTIYGKRIARLRKYTYDVMIRERATLLNLPMEGFLKPAIYSGLVDGAPQESQWDAVPWNSLMEADNNKTFKPGMFKLLADKDNLYLRTRFMEDDLGNSLTKKYNPKDPFTNLGSDNAMELFFYSEATGKANQILINDQGSAALINDAYLGAFAMNDIHGKLDLKVSVKDDCWECDVVLPNTMTGLTRKGDNRFNLIRTRMIKGHVKEYTTASPDAVNPVWANPRLYNSLYFMNIAKAEYGMQAKRLEHDGAFKTIQMPAAGDGLWYTFVPPNSKGKALYNTDGKGMKSDLSLQSPEETSPGCGWNYPVKVKAGGKVLVKLTGIVDTKRPDACLSVNLRWQDGKRKPIEWERLGAVAKVPANGENEVQVTLEADVPEGLGVEYVIVGMGFANAWPGTVTYRKLEVAVIE